MCYCHQERKTSGHWHGRSTVVYTPLVMWSTPKVSLPLGWVCITICISSFRKTSRKSKLHTFLSFITLPCLRHILSAWFFSLFLCMDMDCTAVIPPLAMYWIILVWIGRYILKSGNSKPNMNILHYLTVQSPNLSSRNYICTYTRYVCTFKTALGPKSRKA